MKQRNAGVRKICGCARREWSRCAHPWHFSFQWKGTHHRFSLDRHVGRELTGRTEADREAARIRIEIMAGTFGQQPTARETLTIAQLLDLYLRDYVAPERPRSLRNARYQAGTIGRLVIELPTGERRAFGDCALVDVAPGVLEKFRAASRVQETISAIDKDGRRRARRRGGVKATNRNLGLLRAACNWAVRLGYITATPFKRGTETVVKLSREIGRRRRLEGDEAERLLSACDPLRLNPKTKKPMPDQPPARLRPIVEAALETGCRLGELLSLQWWQVRNLDAERPELVLPASKTKTIRDRVVPISTRLRAILDMRRDDPAGDPFGAEAYVFGNEIGQRTKSIKTAWRLACARANIRDLHFHDLRREAGSRWLEGGVSLVTVRDWLGHTNISQTSAYLESSIKGQHEAMRLFDERRASGRSKPRATKPIQRAQEARH